MDHANVYVALEQVSGKGMPQRVRGCMLDDSGGLSGRRAAAVELTCGERIDTVPVREQIAAWPLHLPPGPQQLEQMRGEHRIAVLAILCVHQIYVAIIPKLPASKTFS